MRQEWSPQPRMCEKCVKNGPPSPRMRENCDKTGPPVFRNFHTNPGCAKTAATLVHQCCCNFRTCENCDKTGPPVLSQFSRKICAKTATRLVHQCFAIFAQTRVVRKLQQHWSTSVAAIFARAKTATRLVHQCCRNFRAKWTIVVAVFAHGGPVLLHFSHVRKLQQHWGDQSCRSFRANQVVRKLQQHWSHQCCCNFRTCEKCNNTGPPMCENCNNNGPFCAKTASTLVQMREKCNNNGSICAKTVSTPVPHVRKVQQHWGQNVRKVCQGLNTIGIYGLGFRV